jgi:CSLREA domain-containing protein
MKLLKSVPSLILTAAILLAASPSASVAADEVEPNLVSIVVNTNADNLSNDGLCSLREAILSANLNSDLFGCSGATTTDIITFAANYTITLGTSDLFVQSPITIIGNGAANTIIQADPQPETANDRVFEVASSPSPTGNLTLNNLTVRYGVAEYGGGILNRGTLTIVNSIVSSNLAYDGGGIYNTGTLTVTNSEFIINEAIVGGGLSNFSGSTATLTDVTFSYNIAEYGGGMYNEGSSPTLMDVTFSANTATSGGGMLNLFSSPTLTNVTFSANTASNIGGGMYNINNSNPTLTSVTFDDNSAPGGGGMYNEINSHPVLTNVTFSGNSASDRGGGMYNFGGSPTLTNVTFSGNSATIWGGGMYNNINSSPTLTNVTFSDNTASHSGGGMYNRDSSPTLTNVTFSDNSALYGGGMYNVFSSPTLINVIIANSVSLGDCVNDSSALNAASRNNLIEDAANACGLTNGVNGNIVGFDPLLDPLADNGGFTQTFALQGNSPAINKGTNTGCPATDQRGVTRPQGTKCDIGAYEKEHISNTLKSQGANDGWILESSETSGVGGTLNKGAATFNLGDDVANKQYRAILSFNTASLPDNAVVTKVTLKVRRQGVTGGGNPVNIFQGFMIDIRKGSFGTNALTKNDFQANANKTIGPFSPTPSSGWYTLNLNKVRAQVNKTGLTQIRLRFKLDDNNDSIANFLSLYSGNAGAANRPQLIVEYYVP